MHAPFETVRERPLPSPAGVNLRLDHQVARAQLAGRLLSFVRRRRSFSARCRDAEFLEQLLRLIFVDVHSDARRALSL